MTTFDSGRSGEEQVLQKYLDSAYALIDKNVEYRQNNIQGRLGEIDLILFKNDVIVLVEVKTRTTGTLEMALQSISKKKLKYIYKTWMNLVWKEKYKHLQNKNVRFDIAVNLNNKITIIENAANFDDF
jgi:putative endonuclease